MPYGIPQLEWDRMTRNQREAILARWLSSPAEGPLQEYDTVEVPFAGSGGLRSPLF